MQLGLNLVPGNFGAAVSSHVIHDALPNNSSVEGDVGAW